MLCQFDVFQVWTQIRALVVNLHSKLRDVAEDVTALVLTLLHLAANVLIMPIALY